MAERYLIDTSAAIKYLNATLPLSGLTLIDEIVDVESTISFITEIELQVWNPTNPDDLAVYESFVNNSSIFGIDSMIIREAIRIRKQHRIKLPDAVIAATAVINGFTLLADNDKDFKNVTGLKYLNPTMI
jgi:predicted nucleic acid-binding protein